MKTIVNTEIKMPKKVFDALCLFETFCVFTNKKEASVEEVKAWLESKSGKQIADGFKPEFLYPSVNN